MFYRCSIYLVSVIPSRPSPRKYATLALSPRGEVAFPAPITIPLKKESRIPRRRSFVSNAIKPFPNHHLLPTCQGTSGKLRWGEVRRIKLIGTSANKGKSSTLSPYDEPADDADRAKHTDHRQG